LRSLFPVHYRQDEYTLPIDTPPPLAHIFVQHLFNLPVTPCHKATCAIPTASLIRSGCGGTARLQVGVALALRVRLATSQAVQPRIVKPYRLRAGLGTMR
jgi:hypothetical protein